MLDNNEKAEILARYLLVRDSRTERLAEAEADLASTVLENEQFPSVFLQQEIQKATDLIAYLQHDIQLIDKSIRDLNP